MIQTAIAQISAGIKQRNIWLGLALGAGIWPLSLLYSPLAATLSDARAVSLAKEAAFIAVLIVSVLGERRRDEHEWLNVRLSPAQRMGSDLVSRTALASCAGWLALLPATVMGGRIGMVDYLELALSSAHLAALYAALQSFKFRASARSVLVTFFALAVPASVQGEAGVGAMLHLLFDPRILLFESTPIWMLTALQATSICVVLLLSGFGDLRSSR